MLPFFSALLDICKEYGAISAKVGTQNDGRPKAYGFVEFPSVEVATEAINSLTSRPTEGEPLIANYAEDLEALKARQAAAKEAREANASPPASDLYLGNLAQVETDDLEAVIEPLLEGKQFQLNRGYYKETGALHPFAFLRFRSIKEASEAKEVIGQLKIGNSRVWVDYPRPKGQDGASAGRTLREHGVRDRYRNSGSRYVSALLSSRAGTSDAPSMLTFSSAALSSSRQE